MEQLFIDLEKLASVDQNEGYIHIVTGNGDKIIKISDLIGSVVDNEFIVKNADGTIGLIDQNPGSGVRNALPRGRCLGDYLSVDQAAEIASGRFRGLTVGDYWLINGIVYRIAHINYWINTGDASCTTPHIVVVPDTGLYNAQMHNTPSGGYEAGAANTTEGGYVGSDMYKTGLNQAKEMFAEAFGEEHILVHRELLVNAVKDGRPSAGAWYNSAVELMNEPMVYGHHFFAPSNDGINIPYLYTIDKTQLALFALCPELISNRAGCWLRDVVSGTDFAGVDHHGYALCHSASHALAVRPACGIR